MIHPYDSSAGLPGDPAQLRLAATRLSDASTELTDQALALYNATQATNSHWVGAASAMWRKLATTHYEQIFAAVHALRDAANALFAYAPKLAQAQHDYAAAIARADAMTSQAVILGAQPAGDAHTTAKRDADIEDYQTEVRRATLTADGAQADARAAAHAAAAELRAIAARAPRDLMATTPSTAVLLRGQPTEAALTLLLSTVHVDANGAAVELDLTNASTLSGASPRAIIAMARALGWKEAKPAKQGGGGIIFFRPGTSRSDSVRVMNGNPKDVFSALKRGPYVIVAYHGVESDHIPLEGNTELGRPPAPPPGPWARAKHLPDAEPTVPLLIPVNPVGDGGGQRVPDLPDPHPMEGEIPQITTELWP